MIRINLTTRIQKFVYSVSPTTVSYAPVKVNTIRVYRSKGFCKKINENLVFEYNLIGFKTPMSLLIKKNKDGGENAKWIGHVKLFKTKTSKAKVFVTRNNTLPKTREIGYEWISELIEDYISFGW